MWQVRRKRRLFKLINQYKNLCKINFSKALYTADLTLIVFYSIMEKGSSSSSALTHLKDFQIKQVLDDYPDTKRLILEGRLAKDSLNPAIVILEKMPFNADKVTDLLQSTSLKTEFRNDIYGKYECFVEDPTQNSLKANVIYPASEKHIAKYKSSKSYIIDETPALYQTITLPHITNESFSPEWVYNILDHKKETERIVYEDSDPETGFILLPDFKWSGKQVDDLYLVAIGKLILSAKKVALHTVRNLHFCPKIQL